MTTFRQQHDLLPGAVVSACSYDATGLEPGEHRGMPSPWLTLVVSLSGPVRTMGTVADPGPFEASRATAYDVLVAGSPRSRAASSSPSTRWRPGASWAAPRPT